MSSQWYFFCLLHQTRFFSVSFSLVHFYRRRREKIISGIIAHFARSTCLHQPVWERSPNSLYKEQKDKIPQVYFILEPRSREGWQRPLHVTLLLRLIKPVTVGSSFRIIFFSSFSFFSSPSPARPICPSPGGPASSIHNGINYIILLGL